MADYTGQDLTKELRENAVAMLEAVTNLKECGRNKARSERDYKVALRKEILRLRLDDGVAWTACYDLALGDDNVAKLRWQRDVYESDYQCLQEKINVLKLNQRVLMDFAKLEWNEHE